MVHFHLQSTTKQNKTQIVIVVPRAVSWIVILLFGGTRVSIEIKPDRKSETTTSDMQ